MADNKQEPKVVDVKVKEFDGFVNTHKATVTTDKGVARTGHGMSEASAINDASDKAKRASR